jgi:hypothetical protein
MIAPMFETVSSHITGRNQNALAADRLIGGDAGLEMAPLNGCLAFQQPVKRGVEFGVTDLAEAEHFAETARCPGG